MREKKTKIRRAHCTVSASESSAAYFQFSFIIMNSTKKKHKHTHVRGQTMSSARARAHTARHLYLYESWIVNRVYSIYTHFIGSRALSASFCLSHGTLALPPIHTSTRSRSNHSSPISNDSKRFCCCYYCLRRSLPFNSNKARKRKKKRHKCGEKCAASGEHIVIHAKFLTNQRNERTRCFIWFSLLFFGFIGKWSKQTCVCSLFSYLALYLGIEASICLLQSLWRQM